MYLISDGGVNANTPDTIEAIMLTKNINYLDGVKLDVRESLDHVFVLSKYNDLSKLTCSKLRVNESSYEYLRKVKFPSHIFKYYIPTLEEILKNYDKKKIIAIEIDELNSYDELYYLLLRYNYGYFFISKNKEVLDELVKRHFNNLGKIINEESSIKIVNSISKNDIYDNTMLIVIKNDI